ncbi:MAG: pyridoxal-phosphate dependent enzyme [Pedobacter sp.]|nr:MAG: pyridoxal-phosphate dependent enzyme [Pedobacter sp.]
MFENIYSPVEKVRHDRLSQLWIKRDDLIDPYISGNKWRKLKYILKHAAEQHKDHLVTFGGAYSNHLVATAAAAARSGLRSTAFVRGEAVENEMLLLCRLYGMQLVFTDRTAYKEKHMLFHKHFGDDQGAYFIDEGGAGAEAVLGCAEIISELPDGITHLFCAAGTGTTAAGLLKGIKELDSNIILHVVPVLKGGDFISEEILKYAGPSAQLIVHTDYHFGGYAKTPPELISFMKSFIQNTGILIDPIYTSKLFYAIDDLSAQSKLASGDKIIALHTGGLLGLFGKKDLF